MPSTNPPHQALKRLLATNPTSGTVARLVVAAADLGAAADRADLLRHLLSHGTPPREVLQGLAGEKAPTLRAAVWAADAWTDADVEHMVATERTAAVRAAALGRPGLSETTYRTAAAPLNKKRATAVLAHADHLPFDLVDEAIAWLLDPNQTADLAASEIGTVLDVLRHPSRAEDFLVAAATGARPLWMGLAACAAPSVPAGLVHEFVCTVLARGQKASRAGSIPMQAHSHLALVMDLVARTDLPIETFQALEQLCEPLLECHPHLGHDLERGQRDQSEDLFEAIAAASSVQVLRALWRSLPPLRRTPRVVAALLCNSEADTNLLDELRRDQPGVTDDWLAQIAEVGETIRTRRDFPPPWLVAYPHLLLPVLRGLHPAHLPTAVWRVDHAERRGPQHGTEQGPDGGRGPVATNLVFRDAAAHPDEWAPGIRAYLLAAQQAFEPDRDVLETLPAGLLLHAVQRDGTPWPHAHEVLLEQVASLITDDPEQNLVTAGALFGLWEAHDLSISEVVTAVDAAS